MEGHHPASDAGAGVTVRGSDGATEGPGGDGGLGLSRLRMTPGADYAALRYYELRRPPRPALSEVEGNCSHSTTGSPSVIAPAPSRDISSVGRRSAIRFWIP